MPDNLSKRARRLFDVAVYAPLGVLAYARDATPTLLTVLIARGRGEADRRSDEVTARIRHVRNYGDALIAFRRGGGAPGAVRDEAAGDPGSRDADDPESSRTGAGTDPEADVEVPRNGSDTANTALPIPSYDSLSASQVVARLPGLASDQLATVRAYEEGHRNRRTILGKIDQLSA